MSDSLSDAKLPDIDSNGVRSTVLSDNDLQHHEEGSDSSGDRVSSTDSNECISCYSSDREWFLLDSSHCSTPQPIELLKNELKLLSGGKDFTSTPISIVCHSQQSCRIESPSPTVQPQSDPHHPPTSVKSLLFVRSYILFRSLPALFIYTLLNRNNFYRDFAPGSTQQILYLRTNGLPSSLLNLLSAQSCVRPDGVQNITRLPSETSSSKDPSDHQSSSPSFEVLSSPSIKFQV